MKLKKEFLLCPQFSIFAIFDTRQIKIASKQQLKDEKR